MSVLLQHLAPDLTIIDYLSVVTEICIKKLHLTAYQRLPQSKIGQREFPP